ncbi:MAG: hypothetical protein IPM42_22185 [Saprospiraceae bacterium]|nr:hypothetical protein [Saprospiraceae bacterium]MBK9258158.1 hypothetical protein [Saprospiraceae bacterium]
MQKILDLILKAFKDEKSRLIFMGSTLIIYILWNEWRAENKLNDAFVMEQLKECKEAHKRCEMKLDQFAEYMISQIESANIKIENLENIIE